MDALGKLDELEALLHGGRRLGGRTALDLAPVLARVAEVRSLLSAEITGARAAVAERDALAADGQRQVAELQAELAAARTSRLTDADVSAESKQILQEASVFAERSLAELEAVLQRVLFSITRARTALDSDGSVLGARGLRESLAPAD